MPAATMESVCFNLVAFSSAYATVQKVQAIAQLAHQNEKELYLHGSLLCNTNKDCNVLGNFFFSKKKKLAAAQLS